MALSKAAAQATKPGKKSTEFYITVGLMIFGAVSAVYSDNTYMQLVGGFLTGGAAISYNHGRSSVKKALAMLEGSKK